MFLQSLTHNHQLKERGGGNLKRDVQYFSHPALIHRCPFFSLLNWLYVVTLNTFVRVQGGSKSIDINIYSTMSLLFLLLSFTLTIVSSFVSLICQRSMSDLSLHADLFFSQLFHIPLCPRHHSSPNLSWHLWFFFFLFPEQLAKLHPLLPPRGCAG